MFDDGLSSVYTEALPLLENHGYKANVAISASKINKRGFLDENQIKELLSSRWALSDHTYSHLNLAKASPQAVKADIALNRDLIQRMFEYSFKDFVIPKSKMRAATLDVVFSYYPVALTGTRMITGNEINRKSRLLLRTEIALYEILLHGSRGVSFVKALNSYLKKLAVNRPEEWFIVFTHGVSMIPRPFDFPKPLFRSLLNTVETYELPIATTEHALRFLNN